MCGVDSQPKGVGSLTILPKNTAMNKEWYQREQLLPTIQEQFGDRQCLFRHDGAPCRKANVLTKWLGEQNIDILGPWPGNSPDLNPIENVVNPQEEDGQTKAHKF